jgi:transcriptional regulator with XRE-family HTH domain
VSADFHGCQYAHVRWFLSAVPARVHVVTDIPEQPPWGRYLQERRERQGRSIRQVALLANLSDAYWGQVERGHQASRGRVRPIKPSRAKLVEMAETLRLTTKETNHLLGLASYPPLSHPGDGQPGFQDYVDLTGLSRRDIRLLNVLADRFREAPVAAAAQQETPAPTPLRRVASGKAKAPQPDRETAAERRAREASSANPDAPPKKNGT